MENRRKIKVVHLITLLELGGAQGNTIHTVKHLNPAVYESVLWTGKGAFWDEVVKTDPQLKKKLSYFKHLVRSIHPVNDLFAAGRLFFALKKYQPDIIHTHSSKAGILGRVSAWLAGVPIVVHTYHGFGFNNQQKPWVRGLFISLERLTAKLTDILIFVSQANMNLATSLSIGEKKQYRLIRSGIPILEIRKQAGQCDKEKLRRDLHLSPDAIVITTIGAFKPQKNLLDFVAMAARLNKINQSVAFLIVGDGVLRNEIENKIRKYNLSERVMLLGWRRDIPDILSISDIFVMTSLWEGLPRALVEAMILNKPTVCYDTDGVKDLLGHGGGELVPQRDVALLTRKIDETIRKLDINYKTSAKLIQKIESEFNIDTMVLQQETLYQELLKQRN